MGASFRAKMLSLDLKLADEIRRGSALARDTPRELRCMGGGIRQRACGIRGVVEAMAVVKMD